MILHCYVDLYFSNNHADQGLYAYKTMYMSYLGKLLLISFFSFISLVEFCDYFMVFGYYFFVKHMVRQYVLSSTLARCLLYFTYYFFHSGKKHFSLRWPYFLICASTYLVKYNRSLKTLEVNIIEDCLFFLLCFYGFGSKIKDFDLF